MKKKKNERKKEKTAPKWFYMENVIKKRSPESEKVRRRWRVPSRRIFLQFAWPVDAGRETISRDKEIREVAIEAGRDILDGLSQANDIRTSGVVARRRRPGRWGEMCEED